MIPWDGDPVMASDPWSRSSNHGLRGRAAWPALLVLAALLADAGPARAYDGATTHVGLCGQALLGSRLHAFLRQDLGLGLGLFDDLGLEPREMDSRDHRLLTLDLERLDPACGCRPDEKTAQSAAGWVLAGSILAEVPASTNRHHFYAPPLRKGLDNPSFLAGWVTTLLAALDGDDSVRQLLTGTGFVPSGDSALDWLRSPQNPHSIQTFYDHLARAAAEPRPEARRHYLSLAMLSLGALLHLLQDMASPAHVRNDFLGEFLEKLGSSLFDRGSAYERFVARTYGQLGLPAYEGPEIRRTSLSAYFTTDAWTGLADLTHRDMFSRGTLPPPVPVLPSSDGQALRIRLSRRLIFQKPELLPLDLPAARLRTCYQDGPHGPRLAYGIDDRGRLRFFQDERVHEAMARHLLPLAVGFSRGFINHLLRSRISLKQEGSRVTLTNTGPTAASGSITILVENQAGRRDHLLHAPLRTPLSEGEALPPIDLTLPREARALVVLLQGKDASGDPLLATARQDIPQEKSTSAAVPE